MSNNVLNTEIWRDIAGYEGIYQVSNTGKVRRVGGNVLSIHINKQRNNRCTVMLSYDHKQTRKAVHRLVAFAFPEICGEYFDGADIDHKDTDPTNNRAEERRKAVADRTLGRHHTEESKAKMRGRIVSEETRAKLSAIAIKRKRNEQGCFQ